MPAGLTFNGRMIATVPQLADRHGLTVEAMRQALRRLSVAPVEPAPIDARTPVYFVTEVDRAMKARPGKGANLRRR